MNAGSETVGNDPGKENFKEDFPTILPALLVKELRQGLRTKVFVITMVLLPVIMCLPFIFASIRDRYGDPLMRRDDVNGFFWVVATLAILLVNPLRALFSVGQEKTTRSGELLVLTHLSAFRITLQKWISYILQTLLMTVIIFPFLVIRYFLGEVELMSDITILLILFLASMTLTSISLWVSGMPPLYRALYSGAAIVSLFVLGSQTIFSRYFNIGELAEYVVITVILSVALAIWTCLSFLLLTAKNFAPPSENLARNIRLLILGGSLVYTAIMMGDHLLFANHYENILSVFLAWMMLISGVVLGIEMLFSGDMGSIHVEQLRQKGWLSRLLSPLLLPGWQSAVLFVLLIEVIYSSSILSLRDFGNEKEFINVMVAIWSNLVFVIAVFSKLFKRLKEYSLIVFAGIVAIFIVICLVIQEIYGDSSFIGLLPMGSFYTVTSSYGGRNPLVGFYLFLMFSVFLYLMISRRYWVSYFKYRREVKAKGRREEIA